MPALSAGRCLTLTAILSILVASGSAAEPPALPSIDPLALRVEEISAPGVAGAQASPDLKLAGSMWKHLGEPAEQAVIVVLQPGSLAQLASREPEPCGDAGPSPSAAAA